MVISALPSNATPLIFFVAASFVAVLALPVKAPVKFVAVTVLSPANADVVAPKAMFVVPSVNELFAKLLFAIAVPLQTPLVIVPTLVKLDPVTVDFKVVPLKVPASAIIEAVPAAVKRPLASTVKVGMAVVDPYDPAVTVVFVKVADAVTFALPSNAPVVKDTSPEVEMVLPVVRVAALPVVFWFQVGIVPVNKE
jgi:hypothetical protein